MITNYHDFERAFDTDIDVENIDAEKLAELKTSLVSAFQDALMNTVNIEERTRVMTAIASCALGIAAISIANGCSCGGNCHCHQEAPAPQFEEYDPYKMDETAARDYA